MPEHVVFVELSVTGAGQRAVEYGMNAGYYVTVLTQNADQYGFLKGLSHLKVIECNTTDLDGLVAQAKLVDRTRKINGITTTADFFVPQAARLCEVFGLPSMSYKAAAGVRNKFIMRTNLARWVPHLNPQFALAYSLEEALETVSEWGYPLVLKPQNGNDSLYVQLIHSDEELTQYFAESEEWLRDSSMEKGILLESHLDGPEYHVETLQYKGADICLLGIGRKILADTDQGYFAELGSIFPVEDIYTDKLFHEVATALRMLNIDCGVIHTECRVVDGDVKILEINPRLAGDMVGSHIIELTRGLNAVGHVIEISLNRPMPCHPIRHRTAVLNGICMPASGIFRGIANPDEVSRYPGVEVIREMAPRGQFCRVPPRSNADFIGRLIAVADDPDEALRLAQTAVNSVKLF